MNMTIFAEVAAEVDHATDKFPQWPSDPLHAVAILNEEAGELNKAVLQRIYEPHKASVRDIRDEAIQVAAMAIRFLMSMDEYRYVESKKHPQEI